MKVVIQGVANLYPKGNFIQWRITPETSVGPYTISLYRSGGSAGPWDVVAEGLTDRYAAIDDFTTPTPLTTADEVRPNQINQFREFWYKVVVTSANGDTAEALDSGGPLVQGSLVDRYMENRRRKAVRDFRLTLKFNGTDIAILKRRHWGMRCTCVDKVTKEPLRAACTKCWGTGFTDGYWNPIRSWARRLPTSNSTATTQSGASDANDSNFRIPDYPGLEKGDVIVFLKDNTRWHVDIVTSTQLRLQDIHQVITAQVFDRAHIIYRIPIRPDELNPLY